MPFKKVSLLDKYSEIPDVLRHKLKFELLESTRTMSYQTPLIQLAGKRVILIYLPATPDDQNVVDSYGDIFQTPSYLINVKPLLKIEDQVVFEGKEVGMGDEQIFTMEFISPNRATDRVSNVVTTGSIYGIGLNLQMIPEEWLKIRLAKLEEFKEEVGEEDFDLDSDLMGEIFYTTAISYFDELEVYDDVTASIVDIIPTREPSEAIVGVNLSFDYLFSVPLRISSSRMFMDVDRKILTPFSITGNKENEVSYMCASGIHMSLMEYGIFEKIYSGSGISAMKALEIADEEGIPLYQIDNTNISSILPNLQISQEVKDNIINLTNAGKIALVSQTNVQFYDWSGVGYILIDPITGSGAYMISGIDGMYYLTVDAGAIGQLMLLDLIEFAASKYGKKYMVPAKAIAAARAGDYKDVIKALDPTVLSAFVDYSEKYGGIATAMGRLHFSLQLGLYEKDLIGLEIHLSSGGTYEDYIKSRAVSDLIPGLTTVEGDYLYYRNNGEHCPTIGPYLNEDVKKMIEDQF